jgi:hypothetical protein
LLFVNGSGYIKAHRFSYKLYKGRIPAGYVVDHLCQNKLCVNPDHLEAVTSEVNIMRGHHPTTINRDKTHCIRGHPLRGQNLMHRYDGGRECRTCYRDYHRAYYQAHKTIEPIPEDQIAAVQAERGVTHDVAARTVGIRRYIAKLTPEQLKKRMEPTRTPEAKKRKRISMKRYLATLTPLERRAMVEPMLAARAAREKVE